MKKINNWKDELLMYLLDFEPEEFIGIVKLLNIELVNYEEDKPIPREAEELMLDIFNKVESMSRTRRRRFMSFIRKVQGKNSLTARKIGGNYGVNAKDN